MVNSGRCFADVASSMCDLCWEAADREGSGTEVVTHDRQNANYWLVSLIVAVVRVS